MSIDLESLRPTKKWMIMDCVQQAGIDVSAWGYRKKDGKPVALPQSNGGYCYEWSFRSEDRKTLLLCVWWEGLQVDTGGRVVFSENLRAYADTLGRRLENDPKNRKRTVNDSRISRARYFSATVELAHMSGTPVQVVVVTGPVREQVAEEAEQDRAIGRQLDDQAWFVESFDDLTGAFVLVRRDRENEHAQGNDTHVAESAGDAVNETARAEDQFLMGVRPEKYTYKGIEKYRDPKVRRQVLDRSKGVCELTGVPGFLMVNGDTYLETHHIIPLSEGGSDTVENVIALTADAHRQAHFSADREALRARCQDIVARRIGKLARL